MKRMGWAVVVLVFASFLAGCGTVIGGALGAGLGTAAGAVVGNPGAGAKIGVVVGGGIGALYDIDQYLNDARQYGRERARGGSMDSSVYAPCARYGRLEERVACRAAVDEGIREGRAERLYEIRREAGRTGRDIGRSGY